MRIFHWITPFILLLITHLPAWGQSVLGALPEEEQSAVEAIALYPPDERTAVLTVAMHPEILVRMERLRGITERRFTELVGTLSSDDQASIYNLSRYPDLMADLADRNSPRSPAEMSELLADYAEEIHEDARRMQQRHFDLLQDIHEMDMEAAAAFDDMLAPYPVEVQAAAQRLVGLPSVLTVLSDNMSLTVLLGDIYRQNPAKMDRELDSLSVVVAEQQARELTEWKQELEENPEALAEYEKAALEFAGEQAYDDDVYDGPIPDRYQEGVYVRHVWRPYSYWFGWPTWYTYPAWYPYPWWYHWGFYYGPGQTIVIVGLPSNYFYSWHFRHHRHLYYYPHFTDHVISHYYGPRSFGTRVQPVLRQWEQEHRDNLPADWWKDDKNRVDRIREYGRFQMDYERQVAVSRDKTLTERDYLEKNANRYPTLKPVLTEKREPTPTRVPAAPKPTKTTPPATDKRPVFRPEPTPTHKDKAPRQETIDRAKENHENVWDRIRTQPAKPAPPARTEPARPDPPPKLPPRTAPAKKDQPPKQAPPRKKDG